MADTNGGNRPAVVVTAIASTTSLAPDAEDTWRLLLDGRSGVGTLNEPFLDEFDFTVRIGAKLKEDFDEHLAFVIAALEPRAAELGLAGEAPPADATAAEEA